MGKIYRVQKCSEGGGGNQRWCLPDGFDVGDIIEYNNPINANTGQTFEGLVGTRFIISINTAIKVLIKIIINNPSCKFLIKSFIFIFSF